MVWKFNEIMYARKLGMILGDYQLSVVDIK